MNEVYINGRADLHVLASDKTFSSYWVEPSTSQHRYQQVFCPQMLLLIACRSRFLNLAYRVEGCYLCCSKKGFVDSQTGKTKRRSADIQQDVLHDAVTGSKTRSLQTSGAPIAQHGKFLGETHACFIACIGTCDSLWSTSILLLKSTVGAESLHEQQAEHLA